MSNAHFSKVSMEFDFNETSKSSMIFTQSPSQIEEEIGKTRSESIQSILAEEEKIDENRKQRIKAKTKEKLQTLLKQNLIR